MCLDGGNGLAAASSGREAEEKVMGQIRLRRNLSKRLALDLIRVILAATIVGAGILLIGIYIDRRRLIGCPTVIATFLRVCLDEYGELE